MKKVSILALHLSYGGVEKAVCDLANTLSEDYEVEIVSTYKLSDNPAYELKKDIKVKYLMDGSIAIRTDKYKKSIRKLKFITLFKQLFKDYKFNIFRLIKDTFLSLINVVNKRKYIKKYILNSESDIFISTRDYLNKLLGKYAKKDQLKIGWEHNHHHGNTSYYSKIVRSCKHLDRVIFVSKGLCDDYQKSLKDKCVYIPNMVSFENINISKLNNKELTTVCRLSNEKGLFDLIDIFYDVLKTKNDLKLNIIGDGILKDVLVEYVYELGIDKNVLFHGFRDSSYISNALSKTDLYLMTSYTESFGIALLEAFIHGVPAIAFDSAEGARELIINDKNGYLIKNRSKNIYVKKVLELLDNKDKLKEFSKKSIEISKNYTPDNVKKLWKNVLH